MVVAKAVELVHHSGLAMAAWKAAKKGHREENARVAKWVLVLQLETLHQLSAVLL